MPAESLDGESPRRPPNRTADDENDNEYEYDFRVLTVIAVPLQRPSLPGTSQASQPTTLGEETASVICPPMTRVFASPRFLLDNKRLTRESIAIVRS